MRYLVSKISKGRIDSIIQLTIWILTASLLALVACYILLTNIGVDSTIYTSATYWLFFVGVGLNLLGYLWMFAAPHWPLSSREISRGYTTLYSSRVRDVDVIDWKTGAVIVPAGEAPPTRGGFNERVRGARRAWKRQSS